VQGGAKELFARGPGKGHQESEAVQAKLYEEVGRLKMELDWIKKLPGSVERETPVGGAWAPTSQPPTTV